MRDHGAHVVEPGPRLRAEVQRHREIDLALHEEIGVECECVERDRDGSLDRVLDRHEAEVDLALLDRGQDVRHGAKGNRLTSGEIGLRAECLLGERAARPEIADAGHDVRW